MKKYDDSDNEPTEPQLKLYGIGQEFSDLMAVFFERHADEIQGDRTGWLVGWVVGQLSQRMPPAEAAKLVAAVAEMAVGYLEAGEAQKHWPFLDS